MPTSCGPVYGGSGDVMGLKLKTNNQKSTDADVKITTRRGVRRLKPKTMMRGEILQDKIKGIR
jgi:hypothetical protein